MEERRDGRRLWWFAGGIAAGFLGYMAATRPLRSAAQLGAAHLKLLGATRHEIPWSGGTVQYVMLGRGSTPLVMLHGLGDSPKSYGMLCQGLLSDYRICFPILPGHPGTPAPPDLQIGHMVQAVDAVILREFGARDVHLYGNSLGGWVAALYAAAASERLASLMLVNPAGRHGRFRRDLVLPSTEDEAMRSLSGLLGIRADLLPAVVRRGWARDLQTFSEPAVGQMVEQTPQLDEPLGRIATRTTVVVGEHDGVVPPETSIEIAERIGHAGVELIEGGSHIPHLTDVGALRRILNHHTKAPHLLDA